MAYKRNSNIGSKPTPITSQMANSFRYSSLLTEDSQNFKPFDYTKYWIEPSEYDLDAMKLQKLCIQLDCMNRLRHAWKIIDDQIRVISTLMPLSAPKLPVPVQDIEDIKKWIKLQRTVLDHTGITKINATEYQWVNNAKTKDVRQYDINMQINQDDTQDKDTQTPSIRNTKTTTTKDTQTESPPYSQPENKKQSIESNIQNSTNKQNKVVTIQPPELHPLLIKLDKIKEKYSDDSLTKDCGNSLIEGQSELDYFRKARAQITKFIKTWRDTLNTPCNAIVRDQLKESETNLEKTVLGAAPENMEPQDDHTSERLLAKAYRTVRKYQDFRGLFYPVKKLNKYNQFKIQQDQTTIAYVDAVHNHYNKQTNRTSYNYLKQKFYLCSITSTYAKSQLITKEGEDKSPR